MKKEVGVWIDNTRAVIVTVTGEKEEIRQVRSNIEKLVQFSGGTRGRPHYGTSSVSGVTKQELKYTTYLNPYYDGVVSLIRHADSIWIFGPGEAKGEIEKRLQRDEPGAHIVGIETAEKMTDRQIALKVALYYQGY